MSRQMLNEQTFAAPAARRVPERAEKRMTIAGTIGKAGFWLR
jgi:hypothetical protein